MTTTTSPLVMKANWINKKKKNYERSQKKHIEKQSNQLLSNIKFLIYLTQNNLNSSKKKKRVGEILQLLISKELISHWKGCRICITHA